MAVLRALLTVLAFSALVCVPCLLMLIIWFDMALDNAGRTVRRLRRRLRDRRLARRAGLASPHGMPNEPAGPPIEQLAADLRRLGRQRIGVAMRSPIWYAAVRRAYDDRLVLACGALGVEQHLTELEGIDQEIERLRVEGMLADAGLVLADKADHPQDSR